MTKAYRPSFDFPMAILVAGLATSCGGDVTLPDPGEAAKIEIVDGNGQQGAAGAALGKPLVVRVLDTQDSPVPGHEVDFVIADGGGAVQPSTVTTGADGRASAAWTLGSGAGAQHLLARTLQGGSTTMLEVEFTATAIAGSGSVLVKVDGDEQHGPVNSALADSLVVKTTDALGNPVANVEVTWSVSGGGSISPVTVRTDAAGLAAAQRVLGPTAGAQGAQAAVEGYAGSPITFSHTADPANPTALVLIDGDDQQAPAGFEVPKDLVVRLQDQNGNGIGDRAITWVVPSGAGSVTPVSVQTDPTGHAKTRWTLPNAVGEYTVSAVFSGLPPVVFSAKATSDAPTTIEMVSGNGQSAAVGTAVTNPLVVRVTDANDNPVANVSVAWTAVNGGSVSADNSATDAQGLAQVGRTLGLVPGQYTTTAAVEGLQGSPVTFISTATVGAPAKLAITQQPGSPTVSGSQFEPPPVIQVQDAQGNPVAQGGIPIVVTITSGQPGATLENETRNTNLSGRVSFSTLRISGPPDDDYVLTFTANFAGAPLTPVSTGPLTVTAGAADHLVLTTQPSTSAQSGVPFAQQPVVQVVDATGNPVAGTRNITVSIEDGGGTLEGGLTVSTNGGSIASFSDLAISGAAGSRTLLFSSGALTPAVSDPIDVSGPQGTTTSLTVEPPTSTTSGTQVTFTASVSSGGGIPSGTVSFRDNGVEIGTGALDGAGIATFQTTTLTVDQHSFTAFYPGAGAFGSSESDPVAYQVTASNTAPVASPDNFSVSEDGNLSQAAPGVLANDTDGDGDPLTAQRMGQPPSNGDLAFNADGSFTYTPDPDFNGSDQFSYRADDGQASSATVAVTLTVNAVNDNPLFTSGGDIRVNTVEALAFSSQWATGIDPGPPDEASQAVEFAVTLINPADANAFLVPPQVSDAGTLTFAAAQLSLTEPRVISLSVVLTDEQGGSAGPIGLDLTITPVGP